MYLKKIEILEIYSFYSKIIFPTANYQQFHPTNKFVRLTYLRNNVVKTKINLLILYLKVQNRLNRLYSCLIIF